MPPLNAVNDKRLPPADAKAKRLMNALLSHGGTYIAMCALILLTDILSGPYIFLAITYVVPVALAAWYRGYRAALGIAIFLPISRIPIATALEHVTPLPYALVNASIRMGILWLVAKLVTTTSRNTKVLEDEVDILEGMLPICASCKKIRDDKNEWQRLETYISKHSEATFTHGICPDCERKLYPDLADDAAMPDETTANKPS